MSTVEIYFRDVRCAQLTQDATGNLQFQYLDSWLEKGKVPVSLTLPLDKTIYPHEQTAPFVANLLPEGENLRRRLQQLLHIDRKDDLGLLGAIGRECAGALSFWPEGGSPRDNAPNYTRLSLEDYQQWSWRVQQQPLQFRGQILRVSLAGGQSKSALYFDLQNNPYLPVNGAPTTHILKPGIPGCLPASVFTEYLTMALARAVLGNDEVPEVDIWQNSFRVRRYDRPRMYGNLRHLHQEDFCMALGRIPARKYESRDRPEHLLAACFKLLDHLGYQGLVAVPVLERQRLLNQIIMNVLLHNPDAHLKNYALLLQDNGRICVSPLYDSLCTHGMDFPATGENRRQVSGLAAHKRNMCLRIGNAINIDQIKQQDWSQFAIECGFTAAFVRRRVRELAKTLRGVLPDTINSFNGQYPSAGRAANAVRDGVTQQINMILG